MDGNTSTVYECKVFDRGHIMQYDPTQSSPDKSIFSCPCGETWIENEDAGTGA